MWVVMNLKFSKVTKKMESAKKITGKINKISPAIIVLNHLLWK